MGVIAWMRGNWLLNWWEGDGEGDGDSPAALGTLRCTFCRGRRDSQGTGAAATRHHPNLQPINH